MKTRLSIRIKIYLRLCYLLLQTAVLGKRNGVFFKSCSLCRGTVHTKIFSSETTKPDKGIYVAKFRCNKCGAIGELHERWEKK